MIRFPLCMVSEGSFHPLSPNSDQQQFSPNNIHTLSRDKVVRIYKMITKEKMPWNIIVRVSKVPKRTVVDGDSSFDNLCGSHLHSQSEFCLLT